MNDLYMPVEKEYGLTRGALEIIQNHRFPVHILTKSDLVLRDLDLLQEKLIPKARQSLELQAVSLAEQVSRFLEERVQDVRILGELPKDLDAGPAMLVLELEPEGAEKVTYGDVFLQSEQEYSRYNFEIADTAILLKHFDLSWEARR